MLTNNPKQFWKGVDLIGRRTFDRADRLKELEIADVVDNISEEAFQTNIDLKKVFIADSIYSVGEKAFDDCSNLTEIRLPKDLEKFRQIVLQIA